MQQNTVERFSNRVENYVKYRPSYPAEILDLFRDEMNLQKNDIIADIGSGTGISSRLFLENGNKVFGVEPNEAMRAAAEDFLCDFPRFKSVNGTAENTTLPDKSVDFVVAAQAFHWFNEKNTRAEIKRILKDTGFVALIWNERQLDDNDFLRDYEKLLTEFGTDYQNVRHDKITSESLVGFFQSDFRQATFPNFQSLDFEGLKGRILSSSYMPAAENEQYSALLIKLKSLFTEHEENGRIMVLYDTKIFYGQI